MKNKPAVSLNKISKSFTKNGKVSVVFSNLSLEIEPNKFHCFVGPSGVGKSTMLNIIAGLISADGGSVTFPAYEKVRLGYVFQSDILLPWKTISQNIELVLRPYNYSQKKRLAIIKGVLKRVNLLNFRNQYPRELSGGEKQRVNIARALAIDPEIILMDEPFNQLDDKTASNLRNDLLQIWNRSKTTIIFVTHNKVEAIYLADVIHIFFKKPSSRFQKININIPRPREHKLWTKFILNPKVQSILRRLEKTQG